MRFLPENVQPGLRLANLLFGAVRQSRTAEAAARKEERRHIRMNRLVLPLVIALGAFVTCFIGAAIIVNYQIVAGLK